MVDEFQASPLPMQHLPDIFRDKARRELNESPERIRTGLKELKELAQNCQETCDIDFADDFLVQFLRHRKYDSALAFKQLAKFTRFRHDNSALFRSLESEKVLDYSSQFVTVLPFKCPDGCTLILYEFEKWDPDEVPFEDFKQLATMLFVQCLRDPMTQINGLKLLYNYKGVSILKQGRYCTPNNLYLIYQGWVCFPIRIKEVHVINESLTWKVCWSIVQTFISSKLKKRFFVHSSPENLQQFFAKSVLPVPYGGHLMEYAMDKWLREANCRQREFTARGQGNIY